MKPLDGQQCRLHITERNQFDEGLGGLGFRGCHGALILQSTFRPPYSWNFLGPLGPPTGGKAMALDAISMEQGTHVGAKDILLIGTASINPATV